MNQRTRIKICGLSQVADVEAAVESGADAIGLVFHPPSPRCVTLDVAARLARALPPFVTPVGLFVNAAPAQVEAALAAIPNLAAAVPRRRIARRMRRASRGRISRPRAWRRGSIC